MPPAPIMPDLDPSVQRYAPDYMPIPPGPTGGLGYAPSPDWARGPTSRKTPSQTLG